MDVVFNTGVEYVRKQLYPFTISHLIYFMIITGITTYIIDYFLKYRLIRWIYIGTMIVIIASLYNDGGNKREIATDIFKLATI
jgi:vacuolar-type H+-ATPase subunit I/STV1